MHDEKSVVLVVEDEPLLLQLYEEVLAGLGLTVYAASSGLTAIKIFQELSGEIDLIITDLKMPDVDGFELEEQIHAMDDSLPMIAVSAWMNISDYRARAESRFAGVLEKPFATEDLDGMIRRMI